MTSETEVIYADCSDEEEYARMGISSHENTCWAPKLEEIEDMYQQIKNNKLIELIWKCPGKRDPSQSEPIKSEPETTPSSALVRDTESKDFDFDIDEEISPTMLKHSIKSGPIFKSKANAKRTTTLAGILSNMERHRIIERMDVSGGDKTSSSNT